MRNARIAILLLCALGMLTGFTDCGDDRTPKEKVAAERRDRSLEWNRHVEQIQIVKDHRAKSGNVCYAILMAGNGTTRSTVPCDEFPDLIENPDPPK